MISDRQHPKDLPNGWQKHLPGTGRSCLLLVLTLLGAALCLSSVHPDKQMRVSHQAISVSSFQRGGGNAGLSALSVAATCGFLDFPCYLDQATSALTNRLFTAIEPVLTYLQTSTLNFLTQTPHAMTDDNDAVTAIAGWGLTVVDASLVVMVALASYHLLVSRSLSLSQAEFTDLLPRIALAFIAAHLSLLLCRLLIQLNNLLCAGIVRLLEYDFLATFLGNILHLADEGNLLLVSLALFLVGMVLFLLWQMLVRLATIAVLVALAPLALMCLAVPHTQEWGRLWLSEFSVVVLVQIPQTTALCLGGMLALSLSRASLMEVDQALVSMLTSSAVLYLAAAFPKMIRAYVLRPMSDANSSVVGVVARLASTL